MALWDSMNKKIRNMTVWDIGWIKWSVFFFTIIIVKLFPQLLNISFPILIVLMIACAAKPLYKIWIKK